MQTVSSEIQEMLPAWAVAVVLPLPVATFWHEGSGRDFAYVYLFLGCAIVTAERFRQSTPTDAENQSADHRSRMWRAKMTALLLAMTGSVAIFTAFAWSLNGRPDAGVFLGAVLTVLPAVCCVPFLTITTGKPYAAVLFTAFLLAGVKLAGCVIAIIVYGWDAQAAGHLAFRWERPNLLVWFCLAGAMSFSAAFYPLGRRAFLNDRMILTPR